MRVFFNAIFVQVLLSTYVLWRGWNALPKNNFIRLPFVTLFVAELIIYLIGYFGTRHLPFDILHYFAWVGTTWMLLIIYMSFLLMLYDVARFIDKRKKFLPDRVQLWRSKYRLPYFLVSLSIVICSLLWGSYQFYHPTITHMDLSIDKPSKIKELRVVVASDLHAGILINKSVLSLYVDKIMAQKPDVILLVGDLIDYDLLSVKMHSMQEEFRRLKAPYGVFASTGNHDYIELPDEYYGEKIDWLGREGGLTMLRDTAMLVDSSFYLVGREDDKCRNRKQLSQIMKGMDKSLPIIVMNHEPHRLYEEVEAGADVALYGHTHNGQFFPVNLILKFMYELPFGYKKTGNTHQYVSSGLGLAGPQYRIGTISEIVVMDLKFRHD